MFVCILALLFISVIAKGQEKVQTENSSRWDIGIEGMLGFSMGRNFYAFNIGGPGLFLVLNQNLKVGIGAFPSFYLLEGKTGARLGVSPRVDYKNLVLIAPFYHKDSTGEWIWSVGFGYKFHKKK